MRPSAQLPWLKSSPLQWLDEQCCRRHVLNASIICRQVGHKAAAGQAISPLAEAAAMACLSRACTTVLAGLPTSLQEDEQLLLELPADAAELRLAVEWRIDYKRCVPP